MLLGWYIFLKKIRSKEGSRLIYFDREKSTFLWKRQFRQNKLYIKTTFGKRLTNRGKHDYQRKRQF
jgi:hypothetical protein